MLIQQIWRDALIQVLASLCCCVALNTTETLGVIRPDDPYGFINETLNLTCQVTNLSITGDISGSLYFTNQWKGEERVISLQYLYELDDRTVLLEYVVQSESDRGPFTCKLNQSEDILIISTQYVTVEYRAAPVQEVRCQVYNWENMTCSWDLGQDYVNTHLLRVHLYWTIFGDSMYHCPHETRTSCTWIAGDRKGMLYPEETYYLLVVVETMNTLNDITSTASSRYFTVRAFERVKPAPVQNVTISSKTSTCISVSWQRPRRFREFRYQLSWQGLHAQGNDATADTNITVCGLHPAVNYTVLLSAIPIPPGYTEPKGIYSDVTVVHVTTLEDVPSGVPRLHTGSFTYGDCTSQSMCPITIYWKSVPDEERNGVITNYDVTIWRPDKPRESTHFTVEGSRRSYDFANLHPHSNYIVELKARTRVGYSKNSSSIYLPSREKQIPFPSRFLVESSGSLLLVSWRPPAETNTTPTLSVTGYTLYNCTGSRSTCLDEIQWSHISSNQTSYMFHVTTSNHDNTMIGISLEATVANQTLSSGITWRSCIYKKGEKPPQVQNVRFSPEQPNNALRVEWESINCREIPVHVTHYIITHCRFSQRACEGQPVNHTVKNDEASHVIKELPAGVDYQVKLLAVSDAGEGPESEPIIAQVTSNELDHGTVIGLAVGGAFGLVCFLIAVGNCVRVIRRKCRHILYPVTYPAMKDEVSETEQKPDGTLTHNRQFNHRNDTQVENLSLKGESIDESPSGAISAEREGNSGLSTACITVPSHQTDLSLQNLSSVTDPQCIGNCEESKPNCKHLTIETSQTGPGRPNHEYQTMKQVSSNQNASVNKTTKDLLKDDASSQNIGLDKKVEKNIRKEHVERKPFLSSSVDSSGPVSGYIKIGMSVDTQKYKPQTSSGSIDSPNGLDDVTPESLSKIPLKDLKPKHNSITTMSPSKYSTCQTKLCYNTDGVSDYLPSGATMGKGAFVVGTYRPSDDQCDAVDIEECYL